MNYTEHVHNDNESSHSSTNGVLDVRKIRLTGAGSSSNVIFFASKIVCWSNSHMIPDLILKSLDSVLLEIMKL